MKPTPKVEAVEVKPRYTQVDDYLKAAVNDVMLPLHTKISERNMKLKCPDLDLAMEKLGQAMTAINKRLKQKAKDGTYGKDEL